MDRVQLTPYGLCLSDFTDVKVPAYHLREPGDYDTFPTDLKPTTTFLVTDLHVLGLLCCGRRHKGRFIVFAPYEILVSLGATVLDAIRSETGLSRKDFELKETTAEVETRFEKLKTDVPRSMELVMDRRNAPPYTKYNLEILLGLHEEERRKKGLPVNTQELLLGFVEGSPLDTLCSKRIAGLLSGWASTFSGKRTLDGYRELVSGRDFEQVCLERMCDPYALRLIADRLIKKTRKK